MRVVSKKIRTAARGQNCTLRLSECNFNPETTVLAHLPNGFKGMGMKGLDTVAVFACSDCHDSIDGRTSNTGPVDWRDITRALAETHAILIDAGIVEVKP